MAQQRSHVFVDTGNAQANNQIRDINNVLLLFKIIPFLDGRLIEDLAIVSGSNSIEHKLGGVYKGYIITRMTAPVTIYDSTPEGQRNLYLNLYSSGNATISVWVF